MDKIEKFLKRLTKKERNSVARLIQKAIRDELGGLVSRQFNFQT